MNKTTIYYSKEGKAVNDFEAEALAGKMFSKDPILSAPCNKKTEFHTSSEIFITAIRVLIKEGVINKDEVEFILPSNEAGVPQVMVSDKNGNLDAWPKGFCDINHSLIFRII